MKILTIILTFIFFTSQTAKGQGGSYALDFDGSNDYVNIPTQTDIEITGSLTITAWLNTTDANGQNPGKAITKAADYTGWRLNFYSTYGDVSGASKWKFALDCCGSYPNTWETTVSSSGMGDSEWHHVAGVFNSDGSGIKLYIDGILNSTQSASGSNFTSNHDNGGPMVLGARGSTPDNFFEGKIDEVKLWNIALSQSDIQDWMHKPIDTNHSNYSNSTSDNLKAYYQMSNGSGTSLTDNSANSQTGTLNNMVTSGGSSDWVTSNAPIGSLNSAYTTDVEGIWSVTSTNNSDASTGLLMAVSSALSTSNFAVFGNNNTSGTSTSDLPSGVSERTGRIWQVDESGTVSANVTIDISDATGNTVTVGTASNYKLLYRSGTSGDFSNVASGSSKSGDAITFSSYSLADGYYAMGGAGDASLPVELSSLSANAKIGTVELTWVTESEIDNLGFLLERSINPDDTFSIIADYRFNPELQGQGSVTYRTEYLYLDDEVVPGTKYYYVLSDVTANPEYGEPVSRHVDKMVSATPKWNEENSGFIKGFKTFKTYPNPFNAITTIQYELPEPINVRINIIDIKGRGVRELFNGEQGMGLRSVKWEGLDNSKIPVGPGIYFCLLTGGNKTVAKKIVLLK